MSNIAPVIGSPETEREHGDADFSKKTVCVSICAHPFSASIEHQRLVVAAFLLPLGYGLGRDALDAQLHPRHVVGSVDYEKQREGNQIDADQNGNA